MKNVFFTLTILLLLTSSAWAQDPKCQNDGPNRQPCEQPTASSRSASLTSSSASARLSVSALAAAPAPGPVTSGIQPRTPTDSRFIVNEGAGLDTGCTYRSGGPLRITLPVERVVGEVNGEGYLVDPVGLFSKGIISKGYATLRLPAFDIDVNGAQGRPPELDSIYFNGEPIGQLTGDNGIWKVNEFPITIDKLRFGKKGSNGSPSAPGMNVIEIRIDELSAPDENWCMAIDWAEVSFEAMYPVVMIHGNGQSGDFFSDTGFIQPFEREMIPFDNSIGMSPSAASIDANSSQLAQLIPSRAAMFGVKHIHLVTHSKGGLDVRDFLVRKLPQNLGILSVSTLSAPHHGSVGADYVLDAERINTIAGIANSDNAGRVALAKAMPSNGGHPNLRTDFVRRTFNPGNVSNLPRSMTVDGETKPVSYFSFAADANLDHSRDNTGPTIQTSNANGRDETEGSGPLGIPMSFIPYGERAVQEVYRIMGRVASTSVVERTVTEPVTNRIVTVPVLVENSYRGGFRLNDFLVTVDSARLPGFLAQEYVGANHYTIARPFVAERVINVIRSVR